MKIGIMQPYIFPYIGYFQLIDVVDQFVIYDDVQWIKNGWINRNRILFKGKPDYFTLNLKKDSHRLKINQRFFSEDIECKKNKIAEKIAVAYKKAPYFKSVMDIVLTCFSCQEKNVSKFVVNSLRICCDYLEIKTPLILSSNIEKNDYLRSEERLIDINIIMGANCYINLIGGIKLYDKEKFLKNKICLNFLQVGKIKYKQFENEDFISHLSIIDVMMFNSKEETKRLLKNYDIL